MKIKTVDTKINGVHVRERSGVMTAGEILSEIIELPPGSVYRLRRERNAEAYTYLLVVTKKEYDEWEP